MTFHPLQSISSLLSSRWQWNPYNSLSSFFGSSTTRIMVDPNNLMQAYMDCPGLSTIINRRAQMFSNGLWKCVSATDEEKEVPNDPFLKLLRKPNPLQKGNMWLYQASIYHDIYNTNIIYPLRATAASDPICLWHLPNDAMEIQVSGKFYKQSKLEDIITQFILREGGREEKFKPSEIIYNVQNPDKNFIGISKILAQKLPISNIIAAYETRNQLLETKGVQGIISNVSKDGQGGLPLAPAEKERIELSFWQRVGLFRKKPPYIVTQAAVTFTPMSYPTKDLMLFEEVEGDFQALCGAWDVQRDIFPGNDGATFENQIVADRTTYQNGIQPFADDYAELVTTMLRGDERDVKYVLDYSYLACMQEDAQVEAQRENIKATALHTQFTDGVITNEEYRLDLGRAPMPPVDATQSQMEKIINAQVELRGTVGGTTGLIAVNDAVAQGRLDREAAVAIVVNIYGFEQSVAETMVTQTILPPPEPKPMPLNQAA
jgi:hypothetical protein